MSFDLADAEAALKAKDYPAAFAALMTLARNGHEQAMLRLAEMAVQQQISESDLAQLIEGLVKESRANNHHAALALAIIYWKAPGALHDLSKALALLQSCCKSELPEAYASFAKFLMTEGKDMPAARTLNVMELLTQGTERGSIEACFLLGREYSTGERCPIDNLLAYKYLFMASKLGHTESKKFVHLLEGIKDRGTFSSAMQEALDTISEMESRMVRFV